MKTFGVLSSGGDSPGMNCAIRAITRTLIFHGQKVLGINKGYSGLLEKDFIELDASSVGNIIQRGGTILRSSRCKQFFEAEYRSKAAKIIKENMDGLIVIGGDGSFNGAYTLFKEHQIPVIGIPGTIDNDISGTDYTIGHDTAVQTAIEAVDRVRDTAYSHDRVFLIEVMGRNSSSLALKVGLCTGAENVLLPNEPVPYESIAEHVLAGQKRGKNFSIIIVAEGKEAGRSYKIHDKLLKEHDIDSRVCILGHIQRGGSPTAIDRYFASLMGAKAATEVLNFTTPKVTAYRDGMVDLFPFEECLVKEDKKNLHLLQTTLELSI
jgi:6-phosphofructokinase 1